MIKNTYRDSHAESGYGKSYEAAYDPSTYYGQLWQTVERELVKSTLENIRSQGATRCLDFACGTGRILEVVEQVFDESVGVDVSESMIEVASQKCTKSQIVCQDITSIPLDQKFDVVTSFRFFRNAEDQLRVDALRALRNQICPGGWLVANIHGNPLSPGMVALSAKSKLTGASIRTISRTQFEQLLHENGFQVEQLINYSFLPRIGRFFPKWYQKLMQPCERFLPKVPLIKRTSESTLFIAKAV